MQQSKEPFTHASIDFRTYALLQDIDIASRHYDVLEVSGTPCLLLEAASDPAGGDGKI